MKTKWVEDVPTDVKVSASHYGKFAVHVSIGSSKWTVTHLASGYKAAEYDEHHKAKKCAEEFNKLRGWDRFKRNKKGLAITDSLPKSLTIRAKKIRDSILNSTHSERGEQNA